MEASDALQRYPFVGFVKTMLDSVFINQKYFLVGYLNPLILAKFLRSHSSTAHTLLNKALTAYLEE